MVKNQIQKLSGEDIASKVCNSANNEKLHNSLICYAYSQMIVGQLAAIVCATIIFIGSFVKLNHSLLFSWYLFLIAIASARIVLASLFNAYKPSNNLQLWKNLFVLGATLGGASWGLLGFFVFPKLNSSQQILYILILAGITAGAVPTLSAIISASISFQVLALLPFIIKLATTKEFSLFNVALCIYLVYLIHLSFQMYNMIKNSMKLIVENEEMLSTLKTLATHDPLTKVDNTLLFKTNLSNAIKRAKRSKKLLALFYLDLDHFKDVNDTYGHAIGDLLLVAVVKRLQENIRTTDLLARIGGDEFSIILENISSKNNLVEVGEKICSALSIPFQIADNYISVTASIGISVYPIDGDCAENLMENADTAMYYVKKHGRNNIHFSRPVMNNY